MDEEAFIMRRARVLVRAYGCEVRVGSGAEIEESRMTRVCLDNGEIRVPLTEKSKPEHPCIAQIKDEVIANLPADCQIDMACFGVAQVIGNRAYATEEGAIFGHKWRQRT